MKLLLNTRVVDPEAREYEAGSTVVVGEDITADTALTLVNQGAAEEVEE